MKTTSMFAVLVLAVCLVGCENAELVTCQQEKEALQGQLSQANATITEKDASIEELKTKNVEDQKKAMEAVTTMMTKQAAKDEELKDQLSKSKQTVKELQSKIESMEVECNNLKEDLATAEKEKQELMNEMDEVQKTPAQ